MGLVCSVRNLLVAAVFIVLVLIWLYAANVSAAVFFLVLVPAVLGVAFLVLWLLTTTTGLAGYGRLFLLVYVVSIVAIEAGGWWMYTKAESLQSVQINS